MATKFEEVFTYADGRNIQNLFPHLRELQFELDYQRSLTTAQRFEMMFRKSREMAEELIRRGHRRPVEVVKRP